MKSILFFLLFIPVLAFSQNLPDVNGKIVYEKIFEKEGVSKDILYRLSKQFFVDAFKNSNYVIKSEDKDSGQIIGKGFKDMSYFKGDAIFGKKYPMHFTVQTDVKDGKARIRIYDAYYEITHPQYGVLRSTTIEEENIDQAKGIDKSQKKKVKYDEWSSFINSNFWNLVSLYEDKINDKSNIDDNW